MYRRSHIYAIDVATGGREMLTDSIGYWTDPVVSPDGKRVVYSGYPEAKETYEMPHLFVMDIDGGNSTNLTEDFDRPASGVIWDDNNRQVYFTAQDRGYVNVFRSDLSGRVTPVTSGQQVATLCRLTRLAMSVSALSATSASPATSTVFRWPAPENRPG